MHTCANMSGYAMSRVYFCVCVVCLCVCMSFRYLREHVSPCHVMCACVYMCCVFFFVCEHVVVVVPVYPSDGAHAIQGTGSSFLHAVSDTCAVRDGQPVEHWEGTQAILNMTSSQNLHRVSRSLCLCDRHRPRRRRRLRAAILASRRWQEAGNDSLKWLICFYKVLFFASCFCFAKIKNTLFRLLAVCFHRGSALGHGCHAEEVRGRCPRHEIQAAVQGSQCK